MNVKKYIPFYCGILLIILISSCNPYAKNEHELTSSPVYSPTLTGIPTITPLPLLVLDNFTPTLDNQGTHGNMACINYQGSVDDLAHVQLKATFYQNEQKIEGPISSEIIQGKTCFELVDAKYQSEILVKVKIVATSFDRSIQNVEQNYDLGNYMISPFLLWIYPTQGITYSGEFRPPGHISWDFQPVTDDQYPRVEEIPLLSPISGCVILVNREVPRDGKNLDVNNIEMYSPQTGYIIQLGHSSDIGLISGEPVDLSKIDGKLYEPGEQISFLGPQDEGSGAPHTHMSVGISPFNITCSSPKNAIVDAINQMQVEFNGNYGHIDFLQSQYLFIDPLILEYMKRSIHW